MKWSDDYATGVERIDNQHKSIFKMTEDFHAVLDEGRGERVYDTLLRSLDQYVRFHFGLEERCMDEYRCPMAERNREAHLKFVEVLSDYKQRYAAKGFELSDARGLVDTLDNWLSEHICRIDVHLKRHVKKS